MRVVQYHPRAASGDGGITNSVRRLAEAFGRAGAEPVVVSDTDAPPPRLPSVEWRAIDHRKVRGVWLPSDLAGAIADADLLILNSAWTVHNALAGGTARRLRLPYVLAHRGAYDPWIFRRRRLLKRVWWRLAEQRLVAGAAALHVFFPDQAADVARLGYRGPIVVAPNGVLLPDPVPPSRPGEYLLFLGRFDPEHKGLDLLVRAIAAAPPGRLPVLRLHGPDWAGGKDRVRGLVRELRVGDRVVIGDAVYGDEKWSLLAGATAFAYPSRWEGFGNAPAEACALGVPTVVTPYPLGRYLAGHDAAILAQPTAVGLLDALERATAPAARAIGERARDLIREVFTWDAVARAWLDQAAALRRGHVRSGG